ncbi:MAG: glycosyltransferase family 61 protein [Candidatus Thiodiazotropha sp. (ex Myrtea sp. 'scaly one' KF741663)]|nr:glycosyltransferase family 61 protein [Candidatus Thiodiazotropha sp. (ex Myrtea sp. 'scaly one' KF741663)]
MFKEIAENKNNPLRIIYKKYAKRLVKKANLEHRVVRILFKLIKIESNLKKKKKYGLISLTDYCAGNSCKSKRIFEGERIHIPELVFYKDKAYKPDRTPYFIVTPEVCIYIIDNINVLARTDFLFSDNYLIHPNNFDPHIELCTLEQFGRIKYDYSYKYAYVLESIPCIEIPKAVSLLGGGSGNYAHFITEVLPRLIIIDSHEEYSELPIIIDGWIGEPIQNILRLFNVNNRKIIYLDVWKKAYVENLILVSLPSTSPQEFRVNYDNKSDVSISKDVYTFNKNALKAVSFYSQKLFGNINTPYSGVKKVYLTRKAVFKESIQYNLRHIINEDEVIEVFKRFDFEIIDITTLSFPEQFSLFKNIKFVAAPLGAAIANIIFSKGEINILGLAAYYDGANYSYFTNMAESMGHNIRYVLGSQDTKSHENPMHRNYNINTTYLESALNELCN